MKEVDGRAEKRTSNRAAAKKSTSTPPAPQLSDEDVLSAPLEAREQTSRFMSDAPTAASGFAVAASKVEDSADTRPTIPDADDDEDDGRQSGERSVDFDSMRARGASSANTNDGTDLLGLSIPPPPRLPSFTPGERDIETDPPPALHSASLLDAPHSLRPAPDSTPAGRPSFTLLAFVAAFSAIIVTAGMVAVRELTKADAPASARVSVPHEPAAPEPRDTRPRVEQLTARAEPSLQVAEPVQPVDAPEQGVAPSVDVERPAPAANARVAQPVRLAAQPRAPFAPLARGAAKPALAKPVAASAAVSAPPSASPVESSEERLPDPDEPLELPINPYR